MLKILNFFIPYHLRENEDLLLRSYLLVGVSLSNSLINLLGVLAFLFVIKLPSDIAWIAQAFVVGGLVGYGLVLFILAWTGNYFIASNLVVAMLLAMDYIAIQITGGFSNSVMVQLCFLSPAMAFLLTGFRNGLFWLAITCGLSVLSLYSAKMGIGYLTLLPEEFSQLFGVILHFVLFFMIGGAIALFEWVNLLLKTRLLSEKEKYRDIAAVAADSSVVTNSAEALAGSAGRMIDSTLQQKTAIEELLATTEMLNQQAQHNHALAQSTRDAIRQVWQHVDLSKEQIHKLMESMAQVQSSSVEILSFNNVINEIAKQTNLLSLNAMIEAAHASDSSGGFSVVALEIKRLAASSAQAAQDINVLLQDNLKSVREGTAVSESMHQRFAEMTAQFEPLVDSVQDISNASDAQGHAIAEISRAMADIDRAVNENRDVAEKTSTLAGELRSNAIKLASLMSGL